MIMGSVRLLLIVLLVFQILAVVFACAAFKELGYLRTRRAYCEAELNLTNARLAGGVHEVV